MAHPDGPRPEREQILSHEELRAHGRAEGWIDAMIYCARIAMVAGQSASSPDFKIFYKTVLREVRQKYPGDPRVKDLLKRHGMENET